MFLCFDKTISEDVGGEGIFHTRFRPTSGKKHTPSECDSADMKLKKVNPCKTFFLSSPIEVITLVNVGLHKKLPKLE